MNIERIKISDLSFDPANARKHGEKNLASITGSLRRFGQQKPIVIDDKNIVVAGNGTLEAAKALGWKEIDVVRTKLGGIDKTAFALADNRTSELAEWDKDSLGSLLSGLVDAEFDLGEIGFDVGDLEKEFEPDLPDEDEGVSGNGKKLLIVEFDTVAAVNELFDELNGRGFKVKVNI